MSSDKHIIRRKIRYNKISFKECEQRYCCSHLLFRLFSIKSIILFFGFYRKKTRYRRGFCIMYSILLEIFSSDTLLLGVEGNGLTFYKRANLQNFTKTSSLKNAYGIQSIRCIQNIVSFLCKMSVLLIHSYFHK